MKKKISARLMGITGLLAVSLVLIGGTGSGSDAGVKSGKPVSSGNDAIAIVKKLVGKDAARYKFELDEDNQVIPDGQGNFAASREDKKVSKGIDCYVVRVFIETESDSGVSQDNLGWYFVSKSTGKVYLMTDPYQVELKVLN